MRKAKINVGITIDPDDYERLRREAEATCTSIGAVVRQKIRTGILFDVPYTFHEYIRKKAEREKIEPRLLAQKVVEEGIMAVHNVRDNIKELFEK